MTDCQYQHDDGAYVLGALSPVERARFEHHLASCAACRDAVAEIAVLPALLSRVTLDDLRLPAEGSREPSTEPQPEPAPQPDQLMAGLVDAARAKRRRDRWVAGWRYAATAVAAAAVALAVGIGLPTAPPAPDARRATPAPTPAPTSASPVALVAMTPVRSGISVQAEVGLRSGAWGTEVILHCWYPDRGGRTGPFVYQLVAYGPNDKADPIGSWISGPGDDVRMTAITRYSIADLTRIELVGSRGTALLDYDVP
jgi:Putative zinc-finger